MNPDVGPRCPACRVGLVTHIPADPQCILHDKSRGLQVFPRHPSLPFVHRVKGAWQPDAVTGRDKRFTDAELAAEYWAHCFDYLDLYGAAGNHPETRVLERFATLPHWDD